MKRVVFQDQESNCATYELLVPDTMLIWKLSDFLKFMSLTPAEAKNLGFLAEVSDPFHHQSFRLLVNKPAGTLNEPIAFLQNEKLLLPDDVIDLSEKYPIVQMGRTEQQGCELDVLKSHKRNCQDYRDLKDIITPILDKALAIQELELQDIEGKTISSFRELPGKFLQELTLKSQLTFIYRVLSVVWNAPFENISRITGRSQFRFGIQMWPFIAEGMGGICAEKTLAVKFILDVLGVKNNPVFAARAKIPNDIEKQLIEFVQSKGKMNLDIWLEHYTLCFELDNEKFFFDCTNGNQPLIFLDEADFKLRLSGGMKTRMVYNSEKFWLYEGTNLTADLMLMLTEFHKRDLYYDYIFKQQLGLQISSSAFIGVFFDWGGKRSAIMESYYSTQAKKLKLPFPSFMHRTNLISLRDENLRFLFENLLEKLHLKYQHPFYTGDFCFVLQPLTGDFWQRPQISNSIRVRLELP